MKHLQYFETNSDYAFSELGERPLVYYVEETDTVHYFDYVDEEYKTIGNISNDNVITINTDEFTSGIEYTLSFTDTNGRELPSWTDITKFTL